RRHPVHHDAAGCGGGRDGDRGADPGRDDGTAAAGGARGAAGEDMSGALCRTALRPPIKLASIKLASIKLASIKLAPLQGELIAREIKRGELLLDRRTTAGSAAGRAA